MKEPKCKICGGKHYKFQCWQNPRKPIQVKHSVKPKKQGVKATNVSKMGNKSVGSQNERKQLVKRLDQLLSERVRQKGMNSIGENYCYTCGAKKNWKELDCGHFISRRHTPTRWLEDNLRPQCQFCNRNLGGNLKIYEQKLRKELGEQRFNEMVALSRSSIKISTMELQEKYDFLKKVGKTP